ncbi:hypothetical protein TNIN_358611 [Trichonephila inaurata madagascariensis]|uniref:Uncharacterized protein n=1 Tax=Trichonephila inaurata madagascariensis TaxID=2747483 RepID=A0A8X6IMY4_9ARAC|nr:hypothetical protein TNIN_358611 [Trichonephila inaurata madagascariensis]
MTEFNAFYESFFSDCLQEEEPMDWENVPLLPEVRAPFVPSHPPRKMRSLISVQISEPPSLSANRFPNMRALVPKVRTPQAPKVSVMSIVFNVVSHITSYFASFFQFFSVVVILQIWSKSLL